MEVKAAMMLDFIEEQFRIADKPRDGNYTYEIRADVDLLPMIDCEITGIAMPGKATNE